MRRVVLNLGAPRELFRLIRFAPVCVFAMCEKRAFESHNVLKLYVIPALVLRTSMFVCVPVRGVYESTPEQEKKGDGDDDGGDDDGDDDDGGRRW